MKALTQLLLVWCLSCGLAHAKLNVFACEPEWAALAVAIGGDHVNVFSATTPQQDVHYIQARPSLIARLRSADLLVCTGAGLEAGWLPVLKRRANNPQVLSGASGYLEMSDGMPLIGRTAVADRAEGDVHPEGNPHFHLDPRNLLKASEHLAERLALLDPQQATAYQTGQAAFAKAWAALLDEWQAKAAPLKGSKVVVHHLDWQYLLQWLEMDTVATLEPKPGVPPSSRYLADLLDGLSQQPASCVVRTVYQDARPSEWVASRTGMAARVLPHTVDAFDSPDALPLLFNGILDRLVESCR